MEHIQRTIEEIEANIAAHEREIRKHKTTINNLCELAKLPPKFNLDDSSPDSAGGALTNLSGRVRPDQFYGKPLSTAVREALNMLRAAGRAPASVDTIYDLLSEGGYHFDARSRDAGIQGLSVSIGKNSALFVKLKNGLIGVTDWYESTPRRRKKRNEEETGSSAAEGAGVSSDDAEDGLDEREPDAEQKADNAAGVA